MLGLSITLIGCDFFSDGILEEDNKTEVPPSITSIKLNKNTLSMKVGGIDYLYYTVTPSNVTIQPKIDYDSTKIKVEKKSNGLIIEALAEGQTAITVSYEDYAATCIITITGYEVTYQKYVEPYIYSNTSILQLEPGMTDKVFVSLYGGDVSDINNYTWTLDDASICSIQPTGQYCMINAKSTGYTRIKVTNSKAAYPYYMGVYVFDDFSKTTYITTSDNILTMDSKDGDKTITVDLVNAKHQTSQGEFNWEIINENNKQPISIISNGNKAIVTPKSSGICTIRVTNPEALYPLDIVCRVVTIIENVYIEPNTTVLTLSGDKEETITSELKNINYGEYLIDGFNYQIVNPDVATITAEIGNQVFIKGKKNGSTKLIITHENVEYSREVLLISTNQTVDAIDSSYYITTSQNYVKTKVGADVIELDIQLKGGTDGEENDLQWAIINTPTDGISDVIKLETPHGTTNSILSRSAYASFTTGKAYISPNAEGTAVIKITHPKILYPTEILVKVLNKDAIIEEPLYFTGEGLVRFVNGTETTYTVGLKGENKTTSDEHNIKWSNDDNRITLHANETKATLTAPTVGTGNTISHINITHPKVDSPKSVLVLTADTEEELMNMKALYTTKNYYNVEVGNSFDVYVEQVGFKSDNEENNYKYDFSLFSWIISDPSIISIEKSPYNPLNATVKALKTGTTKLTGSIDGYTCEFTITVYPVGTKNIEPDIYFTTSQNVIYINETGVSKNINISAINLSSTKQQDIIWEIDDNSICEIIGNGTSATVTSKKLGETFVKVSHPDCQNELKIYIKVGNQYVTKENTPVIYISSQDVITMLRDDNAQKLQATLINNTDNTQNTFTFAIDNENVAKITAQSLNGIAYISPVGSGQAEITISNTLTDMVKKVLVVVGNSSEELASLTYLTTDSNVVTIGKGNTRTVSVNVKNSNEIVLSGYKWTSSDYNIVSITENQNTAVLKANSVGVARITVTNTQCKYNLEIIVQVVDPIAAAANPYIQLSNNVMILDVGNDYYNVTADLIGGTEQDYSYFEWIVKDPSICQIYAQNETCKIKAVDEGQTVITVRNNKDPNIFDAMITVVCEKKKQSDCYISVPSSIISMKPTDAGQTITANLINGLANDKYNFKWSLDVYDVIDFQYSANVCTITPKQTGTVTITISHPKATYDQQIIITVTEYTTFAFPSDSLTITQGEVNFLEMQIPTTKVKTYVEYEVANSNICTVTGTKTVAQIQAISSGTTTVKAKLIASSTGIEQASAEMMVYVKEKLITDAYITAVSTIYTVQKNKSQTLSATIIGSDIITNDQNDLTWTTNDTDKINIVGISSNGIVKGSSIYINAKQSGEAIVTCSHPKASSDLQFYIYIPGTGEKTISLSKNFITIIKGSKSVQLTASIENLESNNDYNDIEWSSIAANGLDGNGIARVMGSGKTVEIYPVSPGEVTIYAQLGASVAECVVKVEAGKAFTFENSSLRVNPYQTKTIKYTVSPPNAVITWTRNCIDDYWDYTPKEPDTEGNGVVEITGITEGQGILMASTDGGAVAKITIKTAWNYDFTVKGNTAFNITPNETVELDYTVYPENATFEFISTQINEYFAVEQKKLGEKTDANQYDYSYGKFTIKPLKECKDQINLTIRAKNPNNGATVGEVKVTGKIKYTKYNPKISYVSREGKFSRFTDNGEIILGDGESIILDLSIMEENITGQVNDVNFNLKDISLSININVSDKLENGKLGKSFKLTDNNDYIETETKYKINALYKPQYNGSEVNWKNNLIWKVYYRKRTGGTFGQDHYVDDYFGLALKSGSSSPSTSEIYNAISLSPCGWLYMGYDDWGSEIKKSKNLELIEDTSYRETYMSKDEFENNAWLYCPGTPDLSEVDHDVTLEMFNNGTLRHGWYGSGGKVGVDPHVMTENVAAELVTLESTNTHAIQSKLVGYIVFDYVHAGEIETSDVKIPVYREVYKCRNK